MADKVTNLYNAFINNGYAMESEAQFRENLKDPEKRKAAYDALVADGYDMEPYADFESNIGYAPKPQVVPTTPAKQAAASEQAKQSTAQSTTSGEGTAQPAKQPAAKPLRPTTQQKIGMAMQMNQQLGEFGDMLHGKVGNSKRMLERNTARGRSQRKAAAMQARAQGLQAEPAGILRTPKLPAVDLSGKEDAALTSDANEEVRDEIRDMRGATPYAVVMENGKKKVQYMLPDGSLTTDEGRANNASVDARKERLLYEFENRMKGAGLDPSKPKDVELQQKLDAWNEEQRHEGYVFQEAQKKRAEIEERLADAEERLKKLNQAKAQERNERSGLMSYFGDVSKGMSLRGPSAAVSGAGRSQRDKEIEQATAEVMALRQALQDFDDRWAADGKSWLGKVGSGLMSAAKDVDTYAGGVVGMSVGETLKHADELTEAGSKLQSSYAKAQELGALAPDPGGWYSGGRFAGQMVMDPVMWLSMGSGGVASEITRNGLAKFGAGAGRMLPEVAERFAQSSLVRRGVVGVAGSAANMSAFEALGNMREQVAEGGHMEKDEKTGKEVFVPGFSWGQVGKKATKGAILGTAMGTWGNFMGNVGNVVTKRAGTAVGKTAARGGEKVLDFVGEGTIFAAPEIYEFQMMEDDEFDEKYAVKYGYATERDPEKRKAARRAARNSLGFDALEESMLFVGGMKVGGRVTGMMKGEGLLHDVRTVRDRIAELRNADRRNHRSFGERVAAMMDRSPLDVDLTREERDELRRKGYGELSDILSFDEEYKSARGWISNEKGLAKASPGKRGVWKDSEFDGYEAVDRLMYDPSVSEAVKGKVYHLVSGRMIPMSSVMGWRRDGGEDGSPIVVESVGHDGRIITSRQFKTEKAAEREIARIERQAELNTVDIGEKYTDQGASERALRGGYEAAAEKYGTSAEAVIGVHNRVAEYDRLAAEGRASEVGADKVPTEGERRMAADVEKILSEHLESGEYGAGAIRRELKEEYGTDVDGALKKLPEDRSEMEKAVVKEYMKRLFPEDMAADAAPGKGGPSAPEGEGSSEPGGAGGSGSYEAGSEAAALYLEGRELYGRYEDGDPEAGAAIDAVIARMKEAEEIYEDTFGAESEVYRYMLDTDPRELLADSSLSAEEQNAVLNYMNAKAALDGVVSASGEAAERKAAEVSRQIQRRTNWDSGLIVPATLKVDDREVYIVRGTVAMHADGSGVDAANSKGPVIVMDAESGEYEFSSPDRILRVGDSIDPEEEMRTALSAIEEEQKTILGENGVDGSVGQDRSSVDEPAEEPADEPSEEPAEELTEDPNDELADEPAGVGNTEQHGGGMAPSAEGASDSMPVAGSQSEDVAEAMPMRQVEENGETWEEPDYLAATPERAHAYIYNEAGVTTEEADAHVAHMLKAAQKEVEKHEKKAPKVGGSLKRYKDEKEAWAQSGAELQAVVDFWDSVRSRQDGIIAKQEAAEAEERRIEAERQAAERQAEADWQAQKMRMDRKVRATAETVRECPEAVELLENLEPQNMLEAASWVLSTNKVIPQSERGMHGFREMTGYGAEEQKKLFGLFAKAENGGRSLKKLAEDAMQQVCGQFGIPYDNGDALQALLDVLQECGTVGDIRSYIENNRVGQALDLYEGWKARNDEEEAAYEEWLFHQEYGMSREDYDEHQRMWDDYMEDHLEIIAKNFDAKEYYSNIADEEYYGDIVKQEYYGNVIDEMALQTGGAEKIDRYGNRQGEITRRGNEGDGTSSGNESSGARALSGGGHEVLSSASVGDSGRAKTYAGGSGVHAETGNGGIVPSSAVADAASGGRPERAGDTGNAGVDGKGTDNIPEERITARLSENEKDEFGKPFILSSDGSTTFGEIDADSGLKAASIRLSLGENHKDNSGKNHGYGLLHIEAGHGEQIRNAGFGSVEEFVENVARNYTTIKEGAVVAGQQTYLLEISDSHNNTLFVQLSRDGKYWNINSAGIFKKKYSRNKPEVHSRPALGSGKDTDTTEVDSGHSMGATAPAGNSSMTSGDKGNTLSGGKQGVEAESSLRERISEAEKGVNLSPTEAQKKSGNYKKGHVQVGSFEITIENPAGSKRSGTDAKGKKWETTMTHSYGYIRGTESADGDPLDVFISSDIDGWNGRKVYVVDQYNPDGTFDEHKVMLGFNDKDEAFDAYLSNYETGWEKGRRLEITESNVEDFEKWTGSAKRKIKPFSEYRSVRNEDSHEGGRDELQDEVRQWLDMKGLTPDEFSRNAVMRYFKIGYNRAGEILNAIAEENASSREDATTPAHEEAYSITPTKYEGKRKTSDVWLVKFNRELSKEEKSALDSFSREPLTEGRKTSRGWYDRKEGGYMMRSEEAARNLAEMIGNEEAVADAQPLTAEELREAVTPTPAKVESEAAKVESKKPAKQRKPRKAPINRVSLEDVMTDLSTKGESQLSDHSEPVKTEPEVQYEISDDEMRSLANELRELLGIGDDEGDREFKFRDPDELTPQERQRIQSAGIRMAMGLVERGDISFSDYATKMVGWLGNKIRPWLKSFYEAARWTPGYENKVFTPSEEVARFDVENFDKPSADVIRDAEMRVAERKAKIAAEQAQKELIAERNEKRRKDDKQREADTAAVAGEAAVVAGEAAATAESAKDKRGVAEASEKVDRALDKINNQLAILGYFERKGQDPVAIVERKAADAGADLAAQLVDDLGLDLTDLPKGVYVVSADFGEKGGYVRINLSVRSGYEPLRIDIRFDRTGNDSLRLTELMTTIKRGDEQSYIIGKDHQTWLSAPTYGELISKIKEQIGKYLPKEEKFEVPEFWHGADVIGIDRISESQRSQVEDYVKKYPSARLHVLATADDIHDLGLTDKDAEGFISMLEDEETQAFYSRRDKKIYIFANKSTEIPIPEILLHENVHAIQDILGDAAIPMMEAFAEKVLTIERKDRAYQRLWEGLLAEDSREAALLEFMAYSMQWGHKSPKSLERIRGVLDKETLSWFDHNIIDQVYGKENQWRQGTGKQEEISSNLSEETVSALSRGRRGGYRREVGGNLSEHKQSLPDANDTKAVSKWLEENSEAIWKGVDALAKEARKDKKDEIVNGYKRGDEVMWDRYGTGKWEKVKIEDFDTDGSPIFESVKGIMSEKGDWSRVKPADGVFGEAKRVATQAQEDRKKSETPAENPTEKIVEVMRGGKKPAKKKAIKPEQQVGDLFGGLLDEPIKSDNDVKRESDTKGQGVAKGERAHTMGNDAPRTNGGVQTHGTEPTDKSRTDDAKRSDMERGADGTAHGTDEKRGVQSRFGDRGRDAGNADSGSTGAGLERGGAAGAGSGSKRGTDRGTEGLSEGESSSESGRGSGSASIKKQKKPEVRYTRNFRYDEKAGNEADSYTPSERLEANVKAVETLVEVLFGDKPATEEQRAVMSRFRGWGQVDLGKYYNIDHILRETYTGTPINRLARAIQKLDPQGEKKLFEAIKRASLSSYYTPTPIARAMNTFLGLAGYKGGALLDPSMGNGMYEGTLPKSIQERTAITGVELDWLSGQLSRMLYPDANVMIGGFEKSGIAPGSFDVVTSNVPFGDIVVNDPTWKNDASPVKRSAQNRIHNYYAVKMLEATRPGGLVAMLTTSAVMDTPSNQNIRAYIADQGEILGAIRLPDNTFQGTGVVTDMLFIRKWRDDQDRARTREDSAYKELEQAFLSHFEKTAPNKLDGKKEKVQLNGYFEKNPRNLIGEIRAGNQYGKRDAFGLTSKLSVEEIASEVEKAIKRIVGSRRGSIFNPTRTIREVQQAVREAYKGEGDWVSNGNLVVQDGKVGVLTSKSNEYGEVTRTFEGTLKHDKMLPRIKAVIDVRTAMKKLIAGQIEGEKDSNLVALRSELQKAYDNFVGKYGRLQDKNNSFILDDIDGYTIQALESWKNGKFIGLSDIFTKNSIKPALKLDGKKTPQEAVALSLAEYGYLRPDYLVKALGEDWVEKCGDTIFLKPNSVDDYVTRDEYLSGDVVTKLAEARAAAERDKSFERNVRALEEVQPDRILFDDIAIHLGARWIPENILNDFVNELFGIHAVYSSRNRRWDPEKGTYVSDQKSGVRYVPETDSFEINIEKKELGGAAQDWATSKKSAKEILQAALEDKSMLIKKKDDAGNEVIDEEQTELANQKIADLRERFESWLPSDPGRVETLEQIYNDRFNRTVKRHFDGSHLVVPGLMGKELRPHQKDAVWMLINNRGGIVDHIVGAGKTLVMQSAIMEMRRMGIAKKPMIVALKSTVSQIAREFKEAFPSARVLAPNDNDFKKENRKKFIANISLNDYDCVILSHEQYCMLPHTEEAERAVIDEQMWQLDNMIEYLYGTNDKSQMTKKQIKALETRRSNLVAKLEQRLDRNVDREFCFENLGIDYMFVDESHQFKSLPYVTSYKEVAGLGAAKGSDRAVALLTGIRHLQRMHQGDKGTIFLSGTTITNSLVEIYNLLNYLRPRKLEELGMPTFDAWASTFAVHSAELEAGVTGTFAMKDRFRSFDNVPELSQLYAEIADVRNDSNLKLPKPAVDGRTVIVPASDSMQEINSEIVNMLNSKDGSYFGIHPKDPKRAPWGFHATRLSAMGAVSPRLIFPDMDDDGGKVHAVCENVKKYYDEQSEQRGVQLIFCEIGVPDKSKRYDAYTDMVNRFVNDYGIPRDEIAYIQEADSDEKRKDLFQRVRDGKVRILIGGTKNMGTGVNVQDRITDMHMLTVPWTPAALEQCIGRGARQGNLVARDFMDNKVRVHYYATEGSLDLYKYQLLDTKGKMFNQFKMGTVNGERTFDEGPGEEDGFDPAEMVARLSGNPVIFERAKQEKVVKKLRALRNGFERDYQRKKAKFDEMSRRVEKFERLIRLNDSDRASLEREGFKPDAKGVYPTTVKVNDGAGYYGGRTFDKPKEAGEYLLSLLDAGKNVTLQGYGQRAKVVTVNEENSGGLFSSHRELQIGDGVNGIKYTVRLSDDATAAGTAFRNLLKRMIESGNAYRRELEAAKSRMEGMTLGDGVFPKQAELDEAVAKLRELNAEYNKLGKKQEATGDGKTQFMDPVAETGKELTGRETDAGLKEQKALELCERLGLPVRLNRTAEEVGELPSGRQRNAVGFYSRGEELAGRPGVTINLPNLATVRDVVKAIFHEGVWHKGIRLFCKTEEERDRLMDHLYENSSEEVRMEIEAIEAEMFERAKDELSRNDKFLKGHSKPGERIYAGSPLAVALAHVEARRRRAEGEYMRDATEEFGARVQEEVEENGYERMRADKLSFWKRVVDFMEKSMGAILRGLKIRMPWKYGRKEYAAMGSLFESKLREQAPEGPLREAERMAKRYSKERGVEQTMMGEREALRKEAVADRIEELFNQAVSGDLKGKPVEVGRLTEAGRMYLEKLSGLQMKENVSFVLNPSDLVHMYRDHFGENEKDKGNNIPLTKEDIRHIGDVISNPERIVYGVEPDGLKRNLFYFLSSTQGGSYNLLEIYGDRKGNLTAKTFYKTKKAVSQRVLSLLKSEHLTSVTDGASLSDDAKLPKFFEYSKSEGEEDKIRFRDPDMGLEETITMMKAEAMQANVDNLQAKKDAMHAIGGNLNHLRQAMARQREYDITTVKSVSDLARILLDNGLLDDLSKYETKRILGVMDKVVGKQDVSRYVQKVMDIMIDNQLRLGSNALSRLMSIRGSRVDGRGIEVQGVLDPEGQRVAQVVRKTTSLPKDDIENRMAEAMNRMSSSDRTIADEAMIEYAGLQIAHEYVENVTESKAEEKALRESLKEAKADKDAGQLTEDAYRQLVEATEDAIRQNKVERAESLYALAEQLGGVLSESVDRAKAWRLEQKRRVAEIHHNANSDMEGRATDEHHKDDRTQKIVNNSFARFLLAPLATFDQMLRMFGRKSVKGEGYLWNRYMRGWVDATEKEYMGYQKALKVLDAKVSEVFGKKMTWGDLFSVDRKLPTASVAFLDGGEMKEHRLTQGNLLYIYMADKMTDGRMKLRRMGITENDIENIKNFLDPRLMRLADWMQEEFLVDKRNEYNEVHKRMFGASMAAIENYFPLKILANARMENVDVADDTTDTALPATSTGSIIKRRRNNLALDVTGANAFSVILDHVQQMERWAAFAEFNRDLNTLLSYKRFRNQVMNMSSGYGAGKTLWKNFRNVCSMAAGAYRPPIADLDKAAVNIAKGVTAAKVSFRVFTALKQFLSLPAYVSDCNPVHLGKNLLNPVGAWKWCMENLPLFEKRWMSRMAGDPRLMKTDMDWKMWRSRVVELASRVGMSPNAFVDALTVAIGSHAMYETKRAKYLRWGMDEDAADKRAKQDATILFNQTQQSSESAFLSTMQVDRSWLSVLFTVFRNSSMSYTRQLYDAIRNLSHRLTPGYRGLSEEFMAKQMRRDGIDPTIADREAKREYRRGIIRDLVRVGIFGGALQLAWNLGSYLPYMLLGDDEEEKSKMWHDVWSHTMFGSIEGLTGGDVMSAAGNMWATGEGNPAYLTKDMPLASDVLNILKNWDKDNVRAMNDVINLLVQSGLGMNPQSLTDAAVAVMDYCGDDAKTSRECALLIARILNCPQSQLDKIYFDELDLSGEEASRMTPEELAERYARYKMLREAPLTGWMRSGEARDSVMERKRKRVLDRAGKELDKVSMPGAVRKLVGDYEAYEKRKREVGKLRKSDREAFYREREKLGRPADPWLHNRVGRYKRDVKELTEAYLRSGSTAERDSILELIVGARDVLLRDAGVGVHNR